MPRHAHPLDGADNAWLRMESPRNRMTITGILEFERPITRDAFRDLFAERLLIFERFTHRIKGRGTSNARWVPTPDFDLDAHILSATLGDPDSHSDLEALAGELMSQPLDLDRPPWTMHVVEDYRGGSAVVGRLHHVLGDGIALIQVLLSIADEHFDPARAGLHHLSPRKGKRSPLERTARGAFSALKGAVKGTVKAAGAAVSEGAEMITDPSYLLDRARQGLSLGAATARLALLPSDSETVFKGVPGGTKRAAWAPPFPLATVRAIGDALDAKINDVLMATAAGAFRRYLLERGDPVEDVEIGGAVPVNLRPMKDAFKLGNEFGLVFLRLPVGEPTPERRLAEVKARMDRLKFSSEPFVIYGLLHLAGSAPQPVQNVLVDLFAKKASAVLTNVPGPRERLHLGGVPISGLMFWVPQAGHLGAGLSILSYADEVHVGLTTDEALVDDPEAVVQAFIAEFDALAEAFGALA